MGTLEAIEKKILNDTLFDSMLTEWVREYTVEENNELYVLLRWDESTRAEIAKEAVSY